MSDLISVLFTAGCFLGCIYILQDEEYFVSIYESGVTLNHMVNPAVDTHNIEDVERAQGVFGAGESSTAHLDK